MNGKYGGWDWTSQRKGKVLETVKQKKQKTNKHTNKQTKNKKQTNKKTKTNQTSFETVKEKTIKQNKTSKKYRKGGLVGCKVDPYIP